MNHSEQSSKHTTTAKIPNDTRTSTKTVWNVCELAAEGNGHKRPKRNQRGKICLDILQFAKCVTIFRCQVIN